MVVDRGITGSRNLWSYGGRVRMRRRTPRKWINYCSFRIPPFQRVSLNLMIHTPGYVTDTPPPPLPHPLSVVRHWKRWAAKSVPLRDRTHIILIVISTCVCSIMHTLLVWILCIIRVVCILLHSTRVLEYAYELSYCIHTKQNPDELVISST